MCLPNQSAFRRVQTVPLPQQLVCNNDLISSFPQGFAAVTPYGVPMPQEKSKPKRRRKPQKPGLTAKHNERHFVQHNYHDHALDREDSLDDDTQEERRRGGVSVAFPLKLHSVLQQAEADGLGHIVSWQPHGRCFVIHKPQEFTDYVMPRYWKQSKLTSFQRQLNLYGFSRLTRGPDAGGYYHELFLRGKEFLCKQMTRTKVKGTKFKGASSPELEPDFYQMPPVLVSPHTSDEEYSQSNSSSVVCTLPPQQGMPLASFHMPSMSTVVPPTQQLMNDRILDEAVEELFMDELGDNGYADLGNLLFDWDPNTSLADQVLTGQSIDDDLQLGFALEKLFD